MAPEGVTHKHGAAQSNFGDPQAEKTRELLNIHRSPRLFAKAKAWKLRREDAHLFRQQIGGRNDVATGQAEAGYEDDRRRALQIITLPHARVHPQPFDRRPQALHRDIRLYLTSSTNVHL